MATLAALPLLLLCAACGRCSGHQLRAQHREEDAFSTMKLSVEDADAMIENFGVDFTVPVMLGNQRLHLVPDSGSSSLVVSSMLCSADDCPRRVFDPNTATNYTTTGQTTSQFYGSGTLQMQGSQAPLSFGPYQKAREQSFREITHMDMSMVKLWELVKFDGILGLSWVDQVPASTTHAGFQETTVMHNFQVPSFAICISGRLNSSLADQRRVPSRFYWGRPAPLFNAAQFTYVNQVGTDHWVVELSEFTLKFNGQIHGIPDRRAACWDAPCLAVVDTGTSYMSAPSSYYGAVVQAMGGVEIDCANFEMLPDVSFRLGGASGIEVTLKPSMYVNYMYVPPIPGMHRPGQNRTVPPKDLMPVQHICSNQIKLADLPTAQGLVWILGRAFMQEYIVDFDRQGNRIGFAHKGAGSCPGTPDGEAGSLLAGSSGMVNMAAVPRSAPAQYPNLRTLLGDVSAGDSAYGPV